YRGRQGDVSEEATMESTGEPDEALSQAGKPGESGEPAPGARSFQTTGDAYDAFMGRYSRSLAAPFADAVGLAHMATAGTTALDVGCGPGALTGLLVARLGAAAVSACDPSDPFVADCALRNPGVDVRLGRAEAIPFDDGAFDFVLAQLVLHFVSDPLQAALEFRRVARPGGIVGACVWEFESGMQMLRHFWNAAVAVDADAPDEVRVMRFGRAGEIAALFDEAGLVDVVETRLTVRSTYADFDELWAGFLLGIGPAGTYLVSLPEDRRQALRAALFDGVGAPTGEFALDATACCAHGRTPER
ncbi:MAG: methyltransferase domain-containing protein, partial [Ilumatobacteraceae bacterium]